MLVHFEVSDTGPGISESTQAKLFHKFIQADSSITRRYGGTGLGLAICRELVGLMGGEIALVSRLGAGTTFWFTLPLSPAAPPVVRRSALPERLAGLRALVVDGTPGDGELLTRHLVGLGMKVDPAQDALHAIAAVARAGDRRLAYDIVLIDRLTPGLAGAALAERMRALPGTAAMRIVLVCAPGQADMERPTGSAFDAVLVKPVRRPDVLDCLARLFGTEIAGAAVTGAALTDADRRPDLAVVAPRRALNVLLAEDNKVNQHVALAMLRKGGHAVTVADDGGDAVAAMVSGDFDVVLMDMQMPRMDGLEATRRIRAMPPPRGRVPIIALTADAMMGAREYYLEAGMDAYLSKPIQAHALLATLQAVTATAHSDADLDIAS
jgi:CheY-like chemotaxis protein